MRECILYATFVKVINHLNLAATVIRQNIMKTLNIITKKVNAGRFEIVVIVNFEEVNRFETNDMSLVDDINEWKNQGSESELTKFESFEELENYFLN